METLPTLSWCKSWTRGIYIQVDSGTKRINWFVAVTNQVVCSVTYFSVTVTYFFYPRCWEGIKFFQVKRFKYHLSSLQSKEKCRVEELFLFFQLLYLLCFPATSEITLLLGCSPRQQRKVGWINGSVEGTKYWSLFNVLFASTFSFHPKEWISWISYMKLTRGNLLHEKRSQMRTSD